MCASPRLGCAQEFIAKLPDGLTTYLDRRVRGHYSGLPEVTKALFGHCEASYSVMCGASGMNASGSGAGLLSGG